METGSRRAVVLALGSALPVGTAGCGSRTANPTDGNSPTTPNGTESSPLTVSVSAREIDAVDPDRPVFVFSPVLRSAVRSAIVTGDVVRVSRTIPPWDSRPVEFTKLSSVRIQAEAMRSYDDTAYVVESQWKPLYEYPFDVSRISRDAIPEEATIIEVSSLREISRKKLRRAIDDGSITLSPLEDVFHRLVPPSAIHPGERTVAYLSFNGKTYEAVKRTFTSVPTSQLYVGISMTPRDSSRRTLDVRPIESSTRTAIRQALSNYADGHETFESEAENFNSFVEGGRLLLTFSNLFEIESSRA